jgi:MFS family permease
MIVKIFSGTLSDWLHNRKRLAIIGYGLAALTKPLFPLAASAAGVFAARFLDRVGKGIRGAPRDALVADLAPPQLRGAAYGLRQSLDTIGALGGPLLAAALMALTTDNYRVVLWVAVIPACIAMAVLIVGVEEPEPKHAAMAPRTSLRLTAAKRFGAAYWRLVSVYAVFTLARFSEAFLVLRAIDLGVAAALAPMVLVAMNVAYFFSAYPSGVVSDRTSRWRILGIGLALMTAADLALALSSGRYRIACRRQPLGAAHGSYPGRLRRPRRRHGARRAAVAPPSGSSTWQAAWRRCSPMWSRVASGTLTVRLPPFSSVPAS